MSKQFQKIGFKEIKAAPGVFQNNGMIIIFHADDLIVFSVNASAIERLTNDLSKPFWIKDLEKTSQFLGSELNWSEKGSITMRSPG